MSNSVVGALRVTLGMDSAAFEKGLSGAQKTLKRFDRDMQKMAAGFKSIGQTLTVGLTLPIVAFGAASLKAAQQSADAFAQVEAALKSMGGASGKTAADLQASAKSLQNMAAIDDDEILRNVTANLLTFGKIAGPTFDRAQVAIVDLATRLKMELQPATILVGKALNDPIKGLTAMGRAGIQFTESQKSTIKSMVAMGDVAGAQAIILGELERQFGGAAKAAADANPYAKLKIAFGELSETIGAKLIPVFLPLINGLTGLLQRFDGLSPAMQKFVLIGGAIAAALGPVLIVIGTLISAVGTIAAFMAGPAVVALGAFLAPLLPIIAAVAALAAAFYLFRDQITPVLKEWGATVAEVLGPKVAPLIEAVKAAFASFAALVAPLFQPSGAVTVALGAFLGALTRVVGAVTSLLGGAIDFITGVFNALGALLRGDWSAMWGHLGTAVLGLAKGVAGAFAAMFPEVVAWVKKTWEGVKLWLVDKFVGIVKAVGEKVKAVAGFFKALWDAVVGHSYVPDMVDGIRDEFARLDHVMVKPALAATEKVKDAFKDLAEVIEAFGTQSPKLVNIEPRLPTTPDPRKAVNGAGPDPIAVPANDHSGIGSTKMTTWGGQFFAPAELADLREQFIGFGKDLAGAIQSGNLKEFFASIAQRFVDKLLTDGLNKLFDALGQMGGGSSGGGFGAILATVFGGGSPVPGFATGGSFKVGGSGGIDSQLMQFHATPGEMVDVRHGNDNGGRRGTNIFDMRGAVVTQDLLNQMNAIAAQGDMQVIGAIGKAQSQRDQAAKYRVARGGR